MGTGLALGMRLAGALGGRLAFDSVPGQGTIVRLTLPVPSRPRTVVAA